MTAATYDTHAAVKRLKSSGFNDQQAEAFVAEITAAQEANRGRHATRGDLLELKADLLKWMFGGFLAIIGMFLAVLLKIS